jgi:hypothetical protein
MKSGDHFSVCPWGFVVGFAAVAALGVEDSSLNKLLAPR